MAIGFGLPELIIVAVVVAVGILVFRYFATRNRTSGAGHEVLPREVARAVERKTARNSERAPRIAHQSAEPLQPAPVRPQGHAPTVFLSYASPDRNTAQALAAALSSEGWSVWWDRTIPPGKTFDQVIEAALDSSACVIVLWSKASVSSDWVKTEASEGARRHILVPALIEDVSIPLEFRRIQAANLVGWNSSKSHDGFRSLVRSVADLLPNERGTPANL